MTDFIDARILSVLEAKNSLCFAIIRHDPHRGGTGEAAGRRQGQRAARLGARAGSHRADRRRPAAHSSTRDRGAGRDTRRRPCPALGARVFDLSRTRPTRQSLCALGARAKPRQGRGGVPRHAEPARILGDLARHHQSGRRRFADQHQSSRCRARPLPRYRQAAARHRRRRTLRRSPRRACAHGKPAENLVAWQRRFCPHRPRH